MRDDEIIINCKEKSEDEQCILEGGLGWIGCHYTDADGDKFTSSDVYFDDILNKIEDKDSQRALRLLFSGVFYNRKCEFRHSDNQLFLSSKDLRFK